MPELPEAETIVRSLRGHLEGARITRVEFRSARVSKSDPARLAGTTVAGVNRYGKQILWELDRGWVLVKLGMTGALLWNSEPGPYTRALVELTNGHVCFDDIRQFGSLSVMATPPNTLGPDPLEITSAAFAQRLRQRDTEVKKLLLDQKFVRGIGNIYADEALFPRRNPPEGADPANLRSPGAGVAPGGRGTAAHGDRTSRIVDFRLRRCRGRARVVPVPASGVWQRRRILPDVWICDPPHRRRAKGDALLSAMPKANIGYRPDSLSYWIRQIVYDPVRTIR